ncbi:MAG: pirin family protein [Flavobacteriaceae bacterium]|nr:pirin family protein [Flavobacteriaceae bacterium]
MKSIIHRAASRGYADHGWLRSHHSFSFAGYHNPERMNFGALRVFNDDVVKPKMGFGTHPHNNMEIISIPLSGALSHKDSMNNKRAITSDEVQAMSAGTGLTHSEFNDSTSEEVNFFQLWIVPDTQNVNPRYDQKHFHSNERKNEFQVLVDSIASKHIDSLKIHQDAKISRIELEDGKTINYELKSDKHGVYIMNIRGSISTAGEQLEQRDAMGIWETDEIALTATENSDILIVEVPMH